MLGLGLSKLLNMGDRKRAGDYLMDIVFFAGMVSIVRSPQHPRSGHGVLPLRITDSEPLLLDEEYHFIVRDDTCRPGEGEARAG